jgi:glycine cleavage system H protein
MENLMHKTSHLKFTKDHEWIDFNSGLGIVGVSEHALEQLGDIVHLELPEVGTHFKLGEAFGTIESTKTVSDLYMPLEGVVVETNKELANKPEAITEDPYKKGWLIKIKSQTQNSDLLTAEEYQDYISS